MMRRVLPVALLLAAVSVYPVLVVAGGEPRFPHRGECIHPAKSDQGLEAVFGRFRDRGAAREQLRRVLGVGFRESKILGDGCGFLRVAVLGIPTRAVGYDLLAEARSVGFHPTLEQAAP